MMNSVWAMSSLKCPGPRRAEQLSDSAASSQKCGRKCLSKDTGIGTPEWMLLEALGIGLMAQGWSQQRSGMFHSHFPGNKPGKHQHLRDNRRNRAPKKRVEKSRQRNRKGARRLSCPSSQGKKEFQEEGRSTQSRAHGISWSRVLHPNSPRIITIVSISILAQDIFGSSPPGSSS